MCKKGLHISIIELLQQYNKPLELQFVVEQVNRPPKEIVKAITNLNKAGVYIHLIDGIVYYTKDKREYRFLLRVPIQKD